jgi:hypothetical protein
MISLPAGAFLFLIYDSLRIAGPSCRRREQYVHKECVRDSEDIHVSNVGKYHISKPNGVSCDMGSGFANQAAE